MRHAHATHVQSHTYITRTIHAQRINRISYVCIYVYAYILDHMYTHIYIYIHTYNAVYLYIYNMYIPFYVYLYRYIYNVAIYTFITWRALDLER